jgi:alpha-methylacyl-CoA racemase
MAARQGHACRYLRHANTGAMVRIAGRTDACFAPILSLDEAPDHPHNRARDTFITVDGLCQPAPAPRFSRTKPLRPQPPEAQGASTHAALADWGIDHERIERLARSRVIANTGIHNTEGR